MKFRIGVILVMGMPLVVAGCGGAGTSNLEPPNHNINFINQVERNVGTAPYISPTAIQTVGTAVFTGGVEVEGVLRDARAIGRLNVRVNFDDERVSMTSRDFAAYDQGNGAYLGNVEGGLSMTDGVFDEVTANGVLAAGYVGTLSGAIEGGTVRGNMIGTFRGETRTDGIGGISRGDSTHAILVYAER